MMLKMEYVYNIETPESVKVCFPGLFFYFKTNSFFTHPAATSAAKTPSNDYRRFSITTYYSGLFRRSF